MSKRTIKCCSVCIPRCIRSCSIVEQKERFHRSVKCPECGKHFEISKGRCPQCSFKLETVCPKCGALNSWDGKSCTECSFMYSHMNQGPSQWYIYKPKDRLGELALPPGQSG